MSTLDVGTILKERYKILEQLGAGGMGEVYLAEDLTLDNKVAVKANHNLNANSAAQFIREARLLASLKQPNLPRVIDYFTQGDTQFLVMDYIPGENLHALVEAKTTFSIQQIVSWAEQLGSAVTYLHMQNPPIFHRDIKPTNIKLMPNGDVVLVDFGIAKVGDPSQETLSGAWAFTPGFAPPEQVSGLRTGPQSDQFSLAATLYYVFAGKPPADSARRLMGEEELKSLKSFVPNIPVHISDAIEKALSIKQDSRFTTVADFVAAIRTTTPIPDPASVQKTQLGTRPPQTSSKNERMPLVPPIMPPQEGQVIKKKTSPVLSHCRCNSSSWHTGGWILCPKSHGSNWRGTSESYLHTHHRSGYRSADRSDSKPAHSRTAHCRANSRTDCRNLTCGYGSCCGYSNRQRWKSCFY